MSDAFSLDSASLHLARIVGLCFLQDSLASKLAVCLFENAFLVIFVYLRYAVFKVQSIYRTDFRQFLSEVFLQPPALPYRRQYSTIGRLWLNRRVRHGNGCFP